MPENSSIPRPKLRWLRSAIAVLALALGILLTCLWARSQACLDQVDLSFRTDQQISVYTRPDGLRIETEKLQRPSASRWHWRYISPEEQRFRSPIFPWEHDQQYAGFAYASGRGEWGLAIPFWFLTLSCAVTAVLVAPKSAWQFSLRRLLAIVTFVAVLLALVVVLSKQRR